MAERVLAFEYAADFQPGANKLPSMHVAMSWIMVCAMWRQASRKGLDVLLAIVLALVTVAPVLVKQHLILDVIVAVPWGLAAYWLAGRAYARFARQGESARDALARLLVPWPLAGRE